MEKVKLVDRDDCTEEPWLCYHYPDTGERITEANERCWFCNRAKDKVKKDRYEE